MRGHKETGSITALIRCCLLLVMSGLGAYKIKGVYLGIWIILSRVSDMAFAEK